MWSFFNVYASLLSVKICLVFLVFGRFCNRTPLLLAALRCDLQVILSIVQSSHEITHVNQLVTIFGITHEILSSFYPLS